MKVCDAWSTSECEALSPNTRITAPATASTMPRTRMPLMTALPYCLCGKRRALRPVPGGDGALPAGARPAWLSVGMAVAAAPPAAPGAALEGTVVALGLVAGTAPPRGGG